MKNTSLVYFWGKLFLGHPDFVETIYQNVRLSGEKGHLSHFIGCLLAGIIRSTLILVLLDHRVILATNKRGVHKLGFSYPIAGR